jgi:hypothetical protein
MFYIVYILPILVAECNGSGSPSMLKKGFIGQRLCRIPVSLSSTFHAQTYGKTGGEQDKVGIEIKITSTYLGNMVAHSLPHSTIFLGDQDPTLAFYLSYKNAKKSFKII